MKLMTEHGTANMKIKSIRVIKQAKIYQGWLWKELVTRMSKAIFMYERFKGDSEEQRKYREAATKALKQMKDLTDDAVALQKMDGLISLLEIGSPREDYMSAMRDLSSYLTKIRSDEGSPEKMEGQPSLPEALEGKVKDPADSAAITAKIKGIRVIRKG